MDYIYELRTYGKDKTLIKIGYTKQLFSRLNSYRSSNPLMEVLKVYKVKDAKNIEDLFHKSHKSIYGNEWYDEDIIPKFEEFIKKYEAVEIFEFLNPFNPERLKLEKKLKIVNAMSFKEVVTECEITEDVNFINDSFNKYSFLKEAIQHLGYDRIRELNYSATNVKRHTLIQSNVADDFKIKSEIKLNDNIINDMFFTLPELKSIIQSVYDNLKYQ